MTPCAEWRDDSHPCSHVQAAAASVDVLLHDLAGALPLNKAVVHHVAAAGKAVDPGVLFVVSSSSPHTTVSFGSPTAERVGIVATHGQGYRCCKCKTQQGSCQHVKALQDWTERHEDLVPVELEGVMPASSDGVMGSASVYEDVQPISGCPVTKVKVSFEHATPAAMRRSQGGILPWCLNCDFIPCSVHSAL
jgi:hypothetical protein